MRVVCITTTGSDPFTPVCHTFNILFNVFISYPLAALAREQQPRAVLESYDAIRDDFFAFVWVKEYAFMNFAIEPLYFFNLIRNAAGFRCFWRFFSTIYLIMLALYFFPFFDMILLSLLLVPYCTFPFFSSSFLFVTFSFVCLRNK